MKQNYGWSKPYAASFAINKSCLRQSNAFNKSVSSIPPTPLLSRFFYHKKKAMLSAVTLSSLVIKEICACTTITHKSIKIMLCPHDTFS